MAQTVITIAKQNEDNLFQLNQNCVLIEEIRLQFTNTVKETTQANEYRIEQRFIKVK